MGPLRREARAGGCSFWEAFQSSRFCSFRRSEIAGRTERWAAFPRKPGAGVEGSQDPPLQVRLRFSWPDSPTNVKTTLGGALDF